MTDLRRRDIRYRLINVVLIPVCAMLYGVAEFVAIAKSRRA